MPLRILIIGSGPAGIAAAQAAKKQDESADVLVVTRDGHLPYFRLRLFDVIADPASREKLYLHDEAWYTQQGINLRLNTEVKRVLPEEHQIELADGSRLDYDRLILATGSRSFVPPIEGSKLPGVETLWTMEEAINIEQSLDGLKQGVVIGGGLLGLEAAFALAKKGFDTTIVEVLPRMMTRQLDEKAAELFTRQVERQGVKVITAATTEEIVAGENGRVKEVRLKDGRVLPADVVFISAGVRAQLDVISDCDIAVDRCIVVNERLETSQKDIYSAGDNTLFDGRWYGLWQISQAQGKAAGTNAAGGNEIYSMPIPPYLVNTMDTRIASAGIITDPGNIENYREEITADEEALSYEKLVYDGDRLIGYVLLGDTKRSNALQKELSA